MALRRNERGSETIEFSLVAPVFFLVVIAALGLTWLAFLKTATAQAAKEAARYASVSLPCPTSGSGAWCCAPTHHSQRRRAEPNQPAERLPLPYPLSVRLRALPDGGAGAAVDRQRASCCLSSA